MPKTVIGTKSDEQYSPLIYIKKKKEETQSFAPLGLLFGNRYGYNTPNQSQALFCSNENVEI
jgi:hypothetical protein